MFVLKLALRPWRQAWISQVFSVIAVTILVSLCGLAFWIQRGIRPVISRLEREQVITAYLKADSDAAKARDAIIVALGAAPERDRIEIVEGAGFLSRLKDQDAELARELESLGEEAALVIPRYISAAGIFKETRALERVREVAGVESAESSRDRNRAAVGAFSAVRWLARVLLMGLAIALGTGLLQVARSNAYLQSDASKVLLSWGASPSFARLPPLLSAILIGSLGGLFAGFIWLFGQSWALEQVRALSPLLREMAAPSPLLAPAMVLLGMTAGAVSGWIGARVR